jgi:hypothetical protein
MWQSSFLLLSTILGSLDLVFGDASPAAPVIKDNVAGVCLVADTDSNEAKGSTLVVAVAVVTALSGQGVNVTININGGPQQGGGPYSKHAPLQGCALC